MGKPLRALIVEDVEKDALLLVRELKRGGYDVTFERVDTADAMGDALARRTWDVVLSDYSMPTFSAPQALAVVKAHSLDLPFIIVSGTVNEDIAVAAIHAGAHDFMAKNKLQRLIPAIERERRNAAMRAEQATMQQQLLQSQRMEAMGQLAGGIAHDFNNILAVILSYATFVRDALPEGDERRADVVEVLKGADRAAGLTRQLLAFCRQQPAAARPTDLNESLTQLHKLLVRTLGDDIALSVLPSARPAVVRIDPVQFDQIVLNLAVNARDAMPGGGELRIVVRNDQDEEARPVVRLSVSDTGTGMDEATQRRIFEPFFTTKERGKGTGLGLATCFAIVEKVGGRIRVESAPGRGSQFTVDLPLCDEPAHDQGRDWDIPLPASGEAVLVVEDEPSLRRATARVLERAGYRVQVASDSLEAMRRIDALGDRLRVVVTDVVMPGASGVDVAAYVARTAPHCRVILTSGYLTDAVHRRQPEELPMLWKPVPPRDLLRAVAQAISEGTASERTRSTESPASRPGELVLVIDCDAPSRRAIVSALNTAGYRALEAEAVATARALVEGGAEPMWILCEQGLLHGDGEAQFLRWIEVDRPNLIERVLILSDRATNDGCSHGVRWREDLVISKPVDVSELLWRLVRTSADAPSRTEIGVPFGSSGDLAQQARAGGTLRRSDATGDNEGGRGHLRESVLVVEDDESLAGAVSRLLGGAGYEVLVAGLLADARSALAAKEFDVLVVDLGLPDGGGLDLVRELRGGRSDVPIVLMTASPSVDSAAEAIRWRVSEYLPKPFPPDDLLRVVRTTVDGGRMARVRNKLLAARFGGNEFVADLRGTEQAFLRALPKIWIAYQPIVRGGDGSLFGYEALLRCHEPDLASPLRLFAAAEVLGRVHEVGRAVRAVVASTMLEHRERLEAIFVNVHPSELRADVLADSAEALLPLARRVVLEVTERASLDRGAKLDEELAHIRGRGYRLAVDDLGEGYAGLSSVATLRPDMVKIDMSLVRDVHRAALKRDIIAGLVDTARRAGIVVVAEGVETVDERDTLVTLGCDLLQGYLFAKPGPAFPVPRTNFRSDPAAASEG
ncbi:MAG: response regulator [Deltaproteobacteria bacterium]|nr:response regulator [Deltaproteobacteria bacterium]